MSERREELIEEIRELLGKLEETESHDKEQARSKLNELVSTCDVEVAPNDFLCDYVVVPTDSHPKSATPISKSDRFEIAYWDWSDMYDYPFLLVNDKEANNE